MRVSLRRAGAAAAVASACVAAAAYLVVVELHRPSMPANDIYNYYVPNILHAVDALHDGGKGLLWNPFQGCGQPFFANGAVGLLYPPHVLFLLLDANLAVHAVLLVNLLIAAAGMLCLCREMGLGWIAAVGGALAVELGYPMAQLSGRSPMHNGSWAWVPWAMFACERVLRAPSVAGVLGLAVVLGLAPLPGFVLIVALTYQLIGLRLGWELLTRGLHRWRAVLAAAAGAALAPLLIAVQLVPAAQFARQSYRVTKIGLEMLAAGAALDLSTALPAMAKRMPPVPFLVAPLLLACLAPLLSSARRLVVFYLATAVLFAVLALGDATPLLGWYLHFFPGPATLRIHSRLFWVSGFCLSALSALAIDGLLAPRAPAAAGRGWIAVAVAAVVAAGLAAIAPGGVRGSEAGALAAIVVAAAVAAWRPRLRAAAAALAVAALAVNLASSPVRWAGGLARSADPLWHYAPTFDAVRRLLSEQDRVAVVPDLAAVAQFKLSDKTTTLVHVRNVFEFDALIGDRFTEYANMMWQGARYTGVDDLKRPELNRGIQPRLLDLAAVRFVVQSPSLDLGLQARGLAPVPLDPADLRVLRNPNALARARWVPRVEVVSDRYVLLERLASGSDALDAVAFVEEPLPSGFSGAGDGAGTVRFVRDDPEHVVLDVDAPQRGFVTLADHDYPGWQATVNGRAVPIVRANYLFRLVEVPAGRSRVEFRYRPASLGIGAGLSALAALLTAGLWWRGRGRPVG